MMEQELSEQRGCRWWFPHHRWIEISPKVIKGAQERGQGFKFGGGFFSEEAADMLYGYTLIEWRCQDCGCSKIEKFTGAMEATCS